MRSYDVKRFIEWWTGDALFRKEMKDNPRRAVQKYKLNVDPDKVWALVDDSLTDYRKLLDNAAPAVKAFINNHSKMLQKRRKLRHRAGTANPVFSRWRNRQMARLAGQAYSKDSEAIAHIPYAIELSKGCSIRCNYCGYNAGRLSAVALFNSENGSMFRDILKTFARFFGEGAETGILYNATEPLDNPDYELYLQAFYNEFAVIPHNTTAAWFRDINRARSLVELNRKHNARSRFSINTRKHLELCMDTFSPSQLRDIALVLQGKTSLVKKIGTGRGRQIPESIPGTIACVTGFVVNLTDRTVKLTAPCIEGDSQPKDIM